MKETISYHINEKFVKNNYLMIKNSLASRRLCKIMLDEKLLKLIILLPNELREVEIAANLKSNIKVIDITD